MHLLLLQTLVLLLSLQQLLVFLNLEEALLELLLKIQLLRRTQRRQPRLQLLPVLGPKVLRGPEEDQMDPVVQVRFLNAHVRVRRIVGGRLQEVFDGGPLQQHLLHLLVLDTRIFSFLDHTHSGHAPDDGRWGVEAGWQNGHSLASASADVGAARPLWCPVWNCAVPDCTQTQNTPSQSCPQLGFGPHGGGGGGASLPGDNFDGDHLRGGAAVPNVLVSLWWRRSVSRLPFCLPRGTYSGY